MDLPSMPRMFLILPTINSLYLTHCYDILHITSFQGTHFIAKEMQQWTRANGIWGGGGATLHGLWDLSSLTRD